jgi:hypothetical protein
MNRQVCTSQDSGKQYELFTLDGRAYGCTCPDYTYRHHACKHLKAYNQMVEFEQALYDVEMALAKLDEIAKTRNQQRQAEEIAAQAERVNMQKLCDYRVADFYEQRAKDIERTRYNNVALSLGWE